MLYENDNYAQFLDELVKLKARTPEWRLGQAAFNLLSVKDSVSAKEVRGTELDPFYLDERLPEFLSWLHGKWESRESPWLS